MSESTRPANLTLAHALHLARAGFNVFPCKAGNKRPATMNGLLDASNDEAVIRRWFDNDRGFNLAVACGPQPNGVNLVAIDIDPGHGGDVAWAALLNGHSVPRGPAHRTRSGGLHLFFDAPENLHNTSGRLGQGIDTRGVGGYVVVPPSRVVDADTGEVGYYTTDRTVALSMVKAPPLPSWLIEMLDDQAEVFARHPSTQGVLPPMGDSPADLLRERWAWDIELEADGWSLVRRRGGDGYWARPGKNPREGHSAVVADDGPLRVFTTECPGGGVLSADGTCRSFSPYDYAKAYRFNGDDRATVAWVRGQPAERAASGPPTADDDATPWPVVPLEYWSASARNQHIFQAAQARRVSPDALDLVVFAYQALLIPPCYVLPPLIGRHQPLNFLACLVGGSGEFKSATLGAAEELIGPLPRFVEVWELGTGEGIETTFLGPEMAVNSKGVEKATGRMIRNNVLGALFLADEGTGLTAIQNRVGATIIPTMCTAWTGGRLGKANSDPLKRRNVAALNYRMTGVVNIQPSLFYDLFTKQNTGGGFTGRFMFSGTTDQARPKITPEWPGPLAPFAPPNITGNLVEIELDPAIVAEIDAEAYTKHGRSSLISSDSQTAQNLPVATRMATIAAMVDDRRRVTADDWEIAKMRVRSSAACLGVLAEGARSDRQAGRNTSANERADYEMTVDERKEARHVARLADAMWRKVQAVPEGIGRNKLIRAVTSDTTRHLGDAALDRLVGDGRGRLIDGRVHPI